MKPEEGQQGGCLVTSHQKGPSGKAGTHLTELCLKVKCLEEAVSSPSPNQTPPTANSPPPGTDINGVVHSLDLLSLLATEGASRLHLEELPRCWLVLDRPSKTFNWIRRASLPFPHQPVSPP